MLDPIRLPPPLPPKEHDLYPNETTFHFLEPLKYEKNDWSFLTQFFTLSEKRTSSNWANLMPNGYIKSTISFLSHWYHCRTHKPTFINVPLKCLSRKACYPFRLFLILFFHNFHVIHWTLKKYRCCMLYNIMLLIHNVVIYCRYYIVSSDFRMRRMFFCTIQT